MHADRVDVEAPVVGLLEEREARLPGRHLVPLPVGAEVEVLLSTGFDRFAITTLISAQQRSSAVVRPRCPVLSSGSSCSPGRRTSGLRLAAYLPSSIGVWPDTGTYLDVTREPLLSEEFLAGWRPWTVPLFYKVMPDSDTGRAAGQLVVVDLLLAVARRGRRLERAAARLANGRVLSRAAVQPQRLDHAVGPHHPERVARASRSRRPHSPHGSRWSGRRAAGRSRPCWGRCSSGRSLRDTGGYMALIAGAVRYSHGRAPRPAARGASDARRPACGHRRRSCAWRQGARPQRRAGTTALLNAIGIRVLTEAPTSGAGSVDHGMPLSRSDARPAPALEPAPLQAERLRYRQTSPTSAAGCATTAARRSPPISRPIRTGRRGPSCDDAGSCCWRPRSRSATYGRRLPGFATRTGRSPLLPAPLAEVAYPPRWRRLVAGSRLVVARGGMACRALGLARPVVAAYLRSRSLLQLPHAAIVWHGDTIEIARHALTVGVVTRLSLLVLVHLPGRRGRSSGAASAARQRRSSRRRLRPRPGFEVAPASGASRAARRSAAATGGRSSRGVRRRCREPARHGRAGRASHSS